LSAQPFLEADCAEARFAQRDERVLLDPAAVVSGLGVAHDLARVADRLQIAGDDFVKRRSLRAGDLDDAASRRRERHIGNDGSNVVRRDGLEQADSPTSRMAGSSSRPSETQNLRNESGRQPPRAAEIVFASRW
jgi:hypothetical protein